MGYVAPSYPGIVDGWVKARNWGMWCVRRRAQRVLGRRQRLQGGGVGAEWAGKGNLGSFSVEGNVQPLPLVELNALLCEGP